MLLYLLALLRHPECSEVTLHRIDVTFLDAVNLKQFRQRLLILLRQVLEPLAAVLR
jgi:hypothetical protein